MASIEFLNILEAGRWLIIGGIVFLFCWISQANAKADKDSDEKK